MKNLGHLGKISGHEAEQRIERELAMANWQIESSAVLDYANKIDARAVCPADKTWDLQVSTSPKSRRQQATLENRGITPIATSELDSSGLEAADFICQQVCTVQQCPKNPSETPVMINAQSHS